ncbi:MAG: hypothetical protein ACYTEQ_23865 [Planctomycetota bacterium]|jgi:hypothetical protein
MMNIHRALDCAVAAMVSVSALLGCGGPPETDPLPNGHAETLAWATAKFGVALPQNAEVLNVWRTPYYSVDIDISWYMKFAIPRSDVDAFMATIPSHAEISRERKYVNNREVQGMVGVRGWWTPDSVSEYVSAFWVGSAGAAEAGQIGIVIDLDDADTAIVYVSGGTM